MEITTIPKHLPEFKTLTLLVVADTTRAKWYLLDLKEMKRIGAAQREKKEYTDVKRQHNLDEIEKNELEGFSKQLADIVASEAKKTGAKHIITCVPQRIKGSFEKHLPDALKKKIIKQHDANMYRFNGLEILKMLYK